MLISLLFFLSDHYRIYELKNKIKTSTYLYASMMQQISNMEIEKTLKLNDLKRIFWASGFNFFHGSSAFYPYPLGIYCLSRLHYVKKKNKSEYDYQLIRLSTGYNGIFSSPTKRINHLRTDVNTKTSNEIETIHPDLICDRDGDERLLIEYWYGKTDYSKSKLGFFIIDPHLGGNAATTDIGVFSYRLVIVPKPGLFPVIN
ncbi:MAG: hypothetical protein IJT36_09010 [Alphaproteobacteria bacterium]|nr:hypothetical protein [Alphaproteobacteria bacterium]